MNYYLLLALAILIKNEWKARMFGRSWRIKSVHHIL
jgi:hypothetical protein